MNTARTRRSYRYLLVLAAFSTLALAGAKKVARGQEEASQVNSADEPVASLARTGRLVAGASPQQLDSLAASSDLTAALAAAWERVHRSTPTAVGPRIGFPDKAALARFLGFLEGRTRRPIPPIWRKAVESATPYGGFFGFPAPNATGKPSDPLGPASSAALKREGDRWVVSGEGLTVSLPSKDPPTPNEKATMIADRETAYAVVYTNTPGPYKVFAVERRTGRVAWSSRLLMPGLPGGYSGQWWHYVEMQLVAGELAVYGVGSVIAYINVFDRKNGSCECVFSTLLCHPQSPPDP